MDFKDKLAVVTGAASGFFKPPMMAGFCPGAQQSHALTMLNGEISLLDGALRMAPK